MLFGHEDPVKKKLHQQMKSYIYLTQEEVAMEHRMRWLELGYWVWHMDGWVWCMPCAY